MPSNLEHSTDFSTASASLSAESIHSFDSKLGRSLSAGFASPSVSEDQRKFSGLKAEVFVSGAVTLLAEKGDSALPQVNQGLSLLGSTERSRFLPLFEKEVEQRNLPYKLQINSSGNLEIAAKGLFTRQEQLPDGLNQSLANQNFVSESNKRFAELESKFHKTQKQLDVQKGISSGSGEILLANGLISIAGLVKSPRLAIPMAAGAVVLSADGFVRVVSSVYQGLREA